MLSRVDRFRRALDTGERADLHGACEAAEFHATPDPVGQSFLDANRRIESGVETTTEDLIERQGREVVRASMCDRRMTDADLCLMAAVIDQVDPVASVRRR